MKLLVYWGNSARKAATALEGEPRAAAGPICGDVTSDGSIGRYMFRTTMGAFVITCVSLTIVMWFTQAIREFDLITSQRQTVSSSSASPDC